MSLEKEIGALTEAVKNQNEVTKDLTKLIPVVAVHQEKHDDFEENWKPKIEQHEKNFNRMGGIVAVLSVLGGGIVQGVILLKDYIVSVSSGGGH